MTKFLSTLLLIFFITGCAALKDLANLQKPSLEYSDMQIQRINFTEAVLLFKFDVNNPNPIGVTADGYNYSFLVNNNSFLSGSQNENITIGSSRKSVLEVPVTLKFSELLNTFRSLAKSDEFTYDLSTEFLFNIPGKGRQSLPANASGSLPVPKIPRFEFAGFDIESISLSGADMKLRIGINNPNGFPILLNSADYVLDVNGKEWLHSTLSETLRISADGSSEIVVPVQLNAVQMGSVLFDLMRGSREFNYSLNGNASVGAEIKGFSFTENMRINREGIVFR